MKAVSWLHKCAEAGQSGQRRRAGEWSLEDALNREMERMDAKQDHFSSSTCSACR